MALLTVWLGLAALPAPPIPLAQAGPELIKLTDRRGADFCLSPTAEESITELTAGELTSFKQLPWRLYQLDRKFRDEMRPRHGLLRAKEFWMKVSMQ